MSGQKVEKEESNSSISIGRPKKSSSRGRGGRKSSTEEDHQKMADNKRPSSRPRHSSRGRMSKSTRDAEKTREGGSRTRQPSRGRTGKQKSSSSSHKRSISVSTAQNSAELHKRSHSVTATTSAQHSGGGSSHNRSQSASTAMRQRHTHDLSNTTSTPAVGSPHSVGSRKRSQSTTSTRQQHTPHDKMESSEKPNRRESSSSRQSSQRGGSQSASKRRHSTGRKSSHRRSTGEGHEEAPSHHHTPKQSPKASVKSSHRHHKQSPKASPKSSHRRRSDHHQQSPKSHSHHRRSSRSKREASGERETRKYSSCPRIEMAPAPDLSASNAQVSKSLAAMPYPVNESHSMDSDDYRPPAMVRESTMMIPTAANRNAQQQLQEDVNPLREPSPPPMPHRTTQQQDEHSVERRGNPQHAEVDERHDETEGMAFLGEHHPTVKLTHHDKIENTVDSAVNERLKAGESLTGEEALLITIEHMRKTTEFLEEERNELLNQIGHLEDLASAQDSKIHALEFIFRKMEERKKKPNATVVTMPFMVPPPKQGSSLALGGFSAPLTPSKQVKPATSISSRGQQNPQITGPRSQSMPMFELPEDEAAEDHTVPMMQLERSRSQSNLDVSQDDQAPPKLSRSFSKAGEKVRRARLEAAGGRANVTSDITRSGTDLFHGMFHDSDFH